MNTHITRKNNVTTRFNTKEKQHKTNGSKVVTPVI